MSSNSNNSDGIKTNTDQTSLIRQKYLQKVTGEEERDKKRTKLKRGDRENINSEKKDMKCEINFVEPHAKDCCHFQS